MKFGTVQALKRVAKVLNIIYSEEALLKRRLSCGAGSQSRGFMTLQQLERCLLVSSDDCRNFGKRPNKHYSGSTTGDCLSPVGLPEQSQLWKLSVKEKKQLLEREARTTSVAGEDEDDDLPPEAAKPRAPEDQEPISYWSTEEKLYSELLFRVVCRGVIDLTALDGHLAIAAMKSSVPYLGVCQTRAHAEMLVKRLSSVVFGLFLEEGSCFFKPRLAEVLGAAPAAVGGSDGKGVGAAGESGLGKSTLGRQRGQNNHVAAAREAAKATAGKNEKAIRAARKQANARAARGKSAPDKAPTRKRKAQAGDLDEEHGDDEEEVGAEEEEEEGSKSDQAEG